MRPGPEPTGFRVRRFALLPLSSRVAAHPTDCIRRPKPAMLRSNYALVTRRLWKDIGAGKLDGLARHAEGRRLHSGARERRTCDLQTVASRVRS